LDQAKSFASYIKRKHGGGKSSITAVCESTGNLWKQEEIVRRDKIKNKRIPATALDIKLAIRSIDPSKRLVRGWG
jgi:hypothetical protein